MALGLRALLGLTVLVGSGCSYSLANNPHGPITWDELPDTSPQTAPARQTKRERSTEERKPITFASTPERAPRRSSDDTFGGGDERDSAVRTPAGMQIDRALTEFHAARAADKRLSRKSHKHAIRWLRVLSEVDDACTLAPTADDLGAFVRARVSLEVELANDQTKRRALPPDLAKRIDATLGAIDSRVAELRLVAPPGSMGPMRGTEGGELVLRTPVSPMVVTSPFGIREDPIHGKKRFHAGIDFGAPKGTMVYSASRGVVIYANWQGGYGRHIVIDHGDGIRTHYSHLDEIFVNAGEVVKTGDTIGSVGETGRATGPHLHFAVTNHEGQFLDPQELFDRVVDRRRVAEIDGVRKRDARRLAQGR